jgi:hypothetical protein
MTVKEAAQRWGVKVPALREKLNIQRRPELQKEIDSGLVKYFKADGAAYGDWIISKNAMEKWYGPEPNVSESDSNYEEFIRLLQAKVGLDDELTKQLLKHFPADFIIRTAFDVYLKREARKHEVSLQEMVMGLTSSEELVFEIFKKKVELDIAMNISEEEAEMIFDDDYCEFYPAPKFSDVIGCIRIKKTFSDKTISLMRELAEKCQLDIANSKADVEKYIGEL